MICPKCRTPMHTICLSINKQDTLVDICSACGGTWLDAGELDDIVDRFRAIGEAVGRHLERERKDPA